VSLSKRKEKNGTMSTLELAKVKGNETALLTAENGTRKVRNILPKLELRIRIRKTHAVAT
jgi:hypothetical protein